MKEPSPSYDVMIMSKQQQKSIANNATNEKKKVRAWSHMESILGLELVLTQGPF
jgi:hypothetical protein